MTRCRRRVGDMAVDAWRAGVIPIGWGHECGEPVCDPDLGAMQGRIMRAWEHDHDSRRCS